MIPYILFMRLLSMDRRILTAIAVLFIAEFAFTAFVAAGAFDHNEKGESTYTIYIGLEDSTGRTYDPDEAAELMDPVVLKIAGGFTRYKADGGYLGDDGYVYYEKNLIYYISGIDKDAAHKICDAAKKMFNQQSILISVGTEKIEYY